MSIFDKLQSGIRSQSAGETQAIAAEVASEFPINQVLKLSGTLGTGKTTFVQGLAKAWSIKDSVKSPTFTLYSIYQGSRQLIHLDAYRLTDPAQVEDLLIDEFLIPPYCLAVEWPEKVADWIQEDSWQLNFSIEGDRNHRIQLTQRPDKY